MKKELDFLNNNILNNTSAVIACSGGPDSMCLLYLLNSLKIEKNLQLICAHVNHKIRQESEKEAQIVQKYCKENGIIFELLEINEYKKERFSEEDARKKRYIFFNEVITKYHAKYLLTAHHGDDLIETILMRITRGSNLSGYIGIKQINDNGSYILLRPLLTTNKENILKYNNQNNIKYSIDKSNEDIRYTRNRYRKEILPFLKKENTNVHLKYLKFSEELINYDSFVNEYIKRQSIIVDNNIVINKILKENEFIKKKSIELLIKEIQKKDNLQISDKNSEDILKLINKPNKIIDLNNGYKCVNESGLLKIVKYKNVNFTETILDKDVKYGDFNFLFNSDGGNNSNYIIYLNSKEIYLPLKIRSKKSGDKIEVKNLNGHKKISDIFIEKKIPKYKRNNYPIVVDSKNNILWIPGLKKSKFSKDKSEKYDIIIKCEAR